jgi:putative transposase
MIKTFKYKLYHSKKNKYLNEQTKIAGNIYNHCIALHYRYYKLFGKSLNKFQLQKHITKLKKLEKYSFWKKINAQAIQEITDRIQKGYKAFFDNCKKKNKTRKVSPPSFKKVRSYASITFKQDGYKILPFNQIKINNRIYKYWKSRETKGEIKCVTLKKDKLGDWYVYLVCELENDSELISMTGKTAGFDFGCMDFLVKDDGTKIKAPLFFKQNRNKISKANKILSKKTEGSNNYNQAKHQLARLHKKVANKRLDYHFKLAKQLCETYDVMMFETLDISSMKKEHGKKINDLGFSSFMGILESKALEYGKTIHHIDKWFASTKTCNSCGYKNNGLTQNDRTWVCPECLTSHNRDMNAAINIVKRGLKDLKDGASSGWLERIRLYESEASFV